MEKKQNTKGQEKVATKTKVLSSILKTHTVEGPVCHTHTMYFKKERKTEQDSGATREV